MRSKLLKLSLVASLLNAATAAAVTVAVPAPYIMNSLSGAEYSVYYPQTTIDPALYYVAPEFKPAQNDMTTGTTTLSFYVSGINVTKNLVVMVTNTAGSSFPIVLTSCDGVPCTGATGGTGGKYHAPLSGAVTVVLTVADICDLGVAITGCLGTKVFAAGAGGVLIPGVKLNFVESVSTTVQTTTEIAAGTKVTVVPELAGPDLLTCPPAPGFFPGDTTIIIDTNSFKAQANTTYGSSPEFVKLWVKANVGTLTAGTYDSATISQTVTLNSGQVEVPGFTNSTASTPVLYQADYGVQDSAGVVLYCGDDTTTKNTPYPIPSVFATDIQGFLRESNCFVATASYRDGRAPGVMLLRNFRDEVLSEFKLGRDFISWYYTYGPIAADWLIEHPIFRSFFLMLLLPLQAVAWITLHPMILVLPLLGLFLIGFLLRRERSENV